MLTIETKVLDNERIVEIWLTRTEKEDIQLREHLRLLFQQYKQKKYLVAVYESGGGDLLDGTTALILHNRTLGYNTAK